MSRIGNRLHTVLVAALAFYLIPAIAAVAHTRITTDVTWSEHIRAILRMKCMTCHHIGGMAPEMADFTFYGTDTKPGARAWAADIKDKIITGKMPPWQADERFSEFSNARRLTEEEIDYIIAWADGGGPKGPIRDLPVPEEFQSPTWVFGQPDLEFTVPEQHLAAEQMTHNVTHVFDVETEEDKWITGFEVMPGAPESVYSVTLWLLDPEGVEIAPIEMEVQLPYDPLADEDELVQVTQREMPQGPHYLGQWIRGDAPVLFPDEAGKLLRKGSQLRVEVAYDRPEYSEYWEELYDTTRVGLFLAIDNNEIDLLAEGSAVEKKDFTIPANAADHEVRAEHVIDEASHVLGLNPHLGYLGKSFEVKAHYPDGMSRTLLWIPDYNPMFGSSYIFEKPVEAPVGTRFEFIARYDNSEDNWDNPNSPPQTVKGGQDLRTARFTVFLDYMLDNHLKVDEVFVPRERPGDQERGGMQIFSGLPDSLDPKAVDVTMDEADPLTQTLQESTQLLEESESGLKYASNGYHQVEGKLPRPGEFQLFVYDDQSMPLDPRNFAGRTRIAYSKSPDTETQWHESALVYDEPGEAFLSAWLRPVLPVTVETVVQLAGKEETFRFTFEALTSGTDTADDGPAQPRFEAPPNNGWLHMLDDGYHRVECVMREPGELKLYFYDNTMKPLDPRNFAGSIRIAGADKKYPLRFGSPGDAFLQTTIPGKLPIEFDALVWIGGEEKTLTFEFDELTEEPWDVADAAEPPALGRGPHGGSQVYEASNGFNVVEATMPRPGEFRLYFYDGWKNPVNPRSFGARLVAHAPDGPVEVPLTQPDNDNEYLSAFVDPAFPIKLTADVVIAGATNTWGFAFDEPTVDPNEKVDTAMAHMDHTPLHGGWFFMADNLFHHLEGTLPRRGEFRVYFYDDFKQPIDPENFTGTAHLQQTDPDTGEVSEHVIPLELARPGDAFLTARILRELPIRLYTNVWMGGEIKRFDFEFEELTREPARTVTNLAKTPPPAPGDHSHERDPLTIPDTAAEIIALIRDRDRALQWRIANEDWYGLYKSAFDARDLVAALAKKTEGLTPRERGTVANLVTDINLSTNKLDRYGDLNDPARVEKTYAEFSASLESLLRVYDKVPASPAE